MGEPKSIDAPTIVTNPAGIATNHYWMVSPIPNWLTLGENTSTINSSDPSLAGTSTLFTIIATDLISGLTVTNTFSILFKCTKSVDCSASSLTDQTFFVADLI